MSDDLPQEPQPIEPGPVPEGGTYVPPPPPRVPFWSYTDVFVTMGLAIPSMLGGWALVKLIFLVFHLHPSAPALEVVPEMFVGYALLFGAMALLFRVQYEQPFWRSMGWVPARIGFLWNIIFGLVTALVVALIGGLIGKQQTNGQIVEMMKGPHALVLVAIFGTFVAPVCEEIIFRGFLQPLLIRGTGTVAGILLTSALFGGLHYSEYGQSWRMALQIALSGVAFGWMRHVTGSTRASTIMHGAFNALSFITLFAQGGKLP